MQRTKLEFPWKKWIGQRVKRKEDYRFLTGRGQYTDDLHIPGLLYAGLLKSPYAHARIRNIDLSKVRGREGVVCTLTGDEVAQCTSPVPNNL